MLPICNDCGVYALQSPQLGINAQKSALTATQLPKTMNAASQFDCSRTHGREDFRKEGK